MAIRLHTDPACPFAFSAEPSRWRLRWHYGEPRVDAPRQAGVGRGAAGVASEPLATAEIQTIMGGDRAKLPTALARVAQPVPAGADCYRRL
jgi:hypothetical protein